MEDNLGIQMYSPTLRVQNLERSREWYMRALGLDEVYRDMSNTVVSLAKGRGLLLTLFQTPDGGPPPAPAGESGSYVIFLVVDLNQARTELICRGVEPEPVIERAGHRMFWITDPDQHRSAIIQLLPD